MTLTPKRKQNQDEGKKKTNLRWLKKKKPRWRPEENKTKMAARDKQNHDGDQKKKRWRPEEKKKDGDQKKKNQEGD